MITTPVEAPTAGGPSSQDKISKSPLDDVVIKDPLLSNVDKLYQVPIQRLDCSFDVVTPKERYPLQEAVQRQTKTNKVDVTVVFAIRYPSWVSCREHGRQLTEFAATDQKLSLVGTVKDIVSASDHEAVLGFYQGYFRNPIYQDEKWKIYKAMGGKTTHGLVVLWRVIRALKRYKSKQIVQGPKIESETKLQGGVLIFDKQGVLRFAYDEQPGLEFDMEAIAAAVNEVRREAAFNEVRRASM